VDPGLKDAASPEKFLAPYPPDRMEAYRVSPMVNSAKSYKPEYVEPISKL